MTRRWAPQTRYTLRRNTAGNEGFRFFVKIMDELSINRQNFKNMAVNVKFQTTCDIIIIKYYIAGIEIQKLVWSIH